MSAFLIVLLLGSMPNVDIALEVSQQGIPNAYEQEANYLQLNTRLSHPISATCKEGIPRLFKIENKEYFEEYLSNINDSDNVEKVIKKHKKIIFLYNSCMPFGSDDYNLYHVIVLEGFVSANLINYIQTHHLRKEQRKSLRDFLSKHLLKSSFYNIYMESARKFVFNYLKENLSIVELEKDKDLQPLQLIKPNNLSDSFIEDVITNVDKKWVDYIHVLFTVESEKELLSLDANISAAQSSIDQYIKNIQALTDIEQQKEKSRPMNYVEVLSRAFFYAGLTQYGKLKIHFKNQVVENEVLMDKLMDEEK